MSKTLREQIKEILDEPEELSWRIYNKVADRVLGLLDGYEQKLQELADMLKNRPKWNEATILDVENWFEDYEKKFGEMKKEELTKQ